MNYLHKNIHLDDVDDNKVIKEIIVSTQFQFFLVFPIEIVGMIGSLKLG